MEIGVKFSFLEVPASEQIQCVKSPSFVSDCGPDMDKSIIPEQQHHQRLLWFRLFSFWHYFPFPLSWFAERIANVEWHLWPFQCLLLDPQGYFPGTERKIRWVLIHTNDGGRRVYRLGRVIHAICPMPKQRWFNSYFSLQETTTWPTSEKLSSSRITISIQKQ